ncbi:uncharacterized protein [Onthophagus taurus]|uniref:uncharacterized protein n=1 Tax=Onthophagus taurus TaxID=166361 RepID=UPI0039BE7F29
MEELIQYDLNGCENILNQIENENKKYESLSIENERLNSRISAISLSTKKELVKDNVFKCRVKVFNSIFTVHNLLSEKISLYELEMAIRHKAKKFYFVEIYIANSFQKRIIHQNWLISACVKSSKKQIGKSINVKRKITSPVCMLIPFDDSNEEATLKVWIAWPEGTVWPYLQIAQIPIDISYHFDVNNLSLNTTNTKIFSIYKLYDISASFIAETICQSQLYCAGEADLFLETILRNCYHNLDLRDQGSFNRSNDVITVKISVGSTQNVEIKLDLVNHILSMQGNCRDLYLLRRYFCKEMCLSIKTLTEDVLKSLKQWKSDLKNDNEKIINVTRRNNANDIYLELRRIVI